MSDANSARTPLMTASNTDGASVAQQDASAPSPSRRSRRVQSVDHAIDVLEALGNVRQGLGLTAIAQQIGLSKAAAYHLLGTLETRRLVARAADGVRYQLSWALYEMGMQVVQNTDFTRAARPILDDIATTTGESALLGIIDDGSVLYLDRGDGPTGFRMVASAGRRGPLHATASGKALLALTSDAKVWERVTAAPLQKFTSSTITTVKGLRAELAEVRRRGYATCWQEREEGLCSIAVPIRDYFGAVVASLAIAAPSSRLNPETCKQHLNPLVRASTKIASQLGHRSPRDHTPEFWPAG